MADTFNKKEREKKKGLKRKQKQLKKDEKRDNPSGAVSWESMMAYVDENGNLTDSPPDPNAKKKVIDAENIEIGVPKREENPEDFILTGVINYFDDTKGYGFIKTESDDSFFFHQNNISGHPAKGKKVRFEKEKSVKGWTAVKVLIEG